MNILGVVAHTLGYGDACAALAVDGQIVGLIEEERFTRLRYDDTFPEQAIHALLKMGGISGPDVDLVTGHLDPFKGIATRAYWILRHATETLPNIPNQMKYLARYGNLTKQLQQSLGSSRFKFESYPHHACHAAGAFFASPYEHSAFITLDGAGEGLVGSYGVADRTRGVRMMRTYPYPHSLGLAYSALCDHIGFPPPAGPGKIMGLAGYGNGQRFLPLFRKMMLAKGHDVRLDLSYFTFHRNLATPLDTKPWLAEKFVAASGVKRRHRSEPLEDVHQDLAAGLQMRTDEIGLELAKAVAQATGERHLCISGGVALNSVMNGVIEASGAFDGIFVQPASGDAGNTLGSVYLASLAHGRGLPAFECIPYAGPGYSVEEIKAALDTEPVNYRHSDDIARDAAEAIKDGLIIGWFQGRMEFGPRALGNRSILADPQRPDMKDHINARVKHREWFRPFAPSVTREAYREYFTGSPDNPYMTIVASVREPWRSVFPAITHVDGTARVQSVQREVNPAFHRLLEHLGKIHKHPMVLNTSFNNQEPIVCTPRDAIRCFLATEMDRLFIGDLIVDKRGG